MIKTIYKNYFLILIFLNLLLVYFGSHFINSDKILYDAYSDQFTHKQINQIIDLKNEYGHGNCVVVDLGTIQKQYNN